MPHLNLSSRGAGPDKGGPTTPFYPAPGSLARESLLPKVLWMTAPAVEETKKRGLLSALAPFPKPFWVINGVELLERGAYYGMLAVLSVFMTTTLGIPPEQTGILLAIQFPLLYFLPLVAAALADKVGYKVVLGFSFTFLIAGYLALYAANDFGGILLGVTLYGIGAGAFKPIPAATVSHTTSESDRNFGFAIYYWLINMGAFLAPIGMQLAFGVDYRPYFLVSAALSVVNLAVCLFVWRNIKPARREVRVLGALASLGELFRSPAFAILLVIYSGFWFMYAMTTSFMTVYMVQFGVLSESWVPAVVALNALTIIVLGPLLGKVTGKMPSVPLMIAGITIYVAGFLLIGFTAIAALFIAGIVVYSIGEFLTHPGFLAYVSKIAPKERVAVFLGYGFIPIGIGQFLGTLAGGFFYGAYARDLGKPQLFWAVISSIGILTIAALLIYNRVMTARVAGAAPAPAASPRRSGLGAWGVAAVVLLLAPALIAAGAFAPAPGGAAGGDGAPIHSASLATLSLPETTGETGEGEMTPVTLTMPANATGTATFVLTWTDEAAPNAVSTNAPDSFRLHVTAPNGTMLAMSEEVANAAGGEGKIEVRIDGVEPGAYLVEVELVRAGDVATATPLLGPVGATADTGNAWTLVASHQAGQ